MLSAEEKKLLDAKAKEIRILALEMIGEAGKGHLGGAMSIADVLSVLYFKQMNVRTDEPRWPDRDRLVLSKGHAGPALYAALAIKGFFPQEECFTLNKPGTKLPSHCDMNKTIGIDMTAGSLAQGFSASLGMALACRLDKRQNTVYAIVGDGESQEGQIWETAMYAAQQKCSNLIAFVDNNGMQIDGTTDEINSLEPLPDKWKAFGWDVQVVNGHDVEAIDDAINKAKAVTDKPAVIILKTIKGKGVFFAEGKVSSHSMAYNREQAAEAVAKMA